MLRAAVVTSVVAAAFAVSGCGDNRVPIDAPPDIPACTSTPPAPGALSAFDSTKAVRNHDQAGKQTVAFLGALQPGPTADTLDIQLIEGMGAFASGPPVPGTYALTGVETQLATCGVCVVLEGGMPRGYYVARDGMLTVDAVDTHFQASLSNVDFVHVDVDANTSVSTIIDTCTFSIASASWDTPIIAQAR
ncbi:MAG: hypothetical protein JO257_13945 [Deltaproteobacteria bacterium]|nr:hypothetical protein [Deltaproteobacteria bacterium]